MTSRIPGRRRVGLAGFAGLVLTVGLALTGCDPSAADGGAKASATPTVAATTAPAAPTTPPVTSAAPLPAPAGTPPVQPAPPAPVVTPPPPAEPPAQPSAKPQPPATKAPQPKVTTAQPPTDPEPPAAAGAGTGCEIRSNAGNCYEAGQFCRTADLGRSTHDAGGRMIYCRMVSGKPHWQA
ncbi:hypothetical protein ACIQI7_01995 [Kitasatospora sp. NPDC092039]|uniref:hypothetical protein n=1 Tax=Kitasatospora sp. NPDC092039 TaxID=3364086 RepID=UPI00380196A7